MTDILVTGGAGYIGSHTCKALAAKGYRPIVYDNLSQGHRDAVQWGPLEFGDVRDLTRLEAVLAKYRPAAVIHFAGLIAAGDSVRDPGTFYDNNVGGFVTLMAAMQRADIKRLVFSSTAAVYGEPDSVPISESHRLAPTNPYGRTKLMCEQILQDHVEADGFQGIALRYFNACGADQDGDTGEAHDPETHLIPLILDAAAGHRSDIAVFGDDYDTPDGTCIRDYVHVSDLAAAHVLGLTRILDRPGFEAINLGNGVGYSVNQVIGAAQSVVGAEIPVRVEARRPGDPAVLVADIALAEECLGWRPEHTALTDQITDAWKWHQRQATCLPRKTTYDRDSQPTGGDRLVGVTAARAH